MINVAVTPDETVAVDVLSEVITQAGGGVWFGTRQEYDALPSSNRHNPEILHCIREGT